jgi:hypothetical protein
VDDDVVTSGDTSSPGSAPSRVEIRGSDQGVFLNNPTVTARWNGEVVGQFASLGGRLAFDIDSAGELRLRAGIRSTSVQLDARGAVVTLRWDRLWGRLIASVEPAVAR